jgi:hypothetical protein
MGPSLINALISISISIVSIPSFARLARGSVLVVRELDYAKAAQVLGASRARIMFLHIAPNITPNVSLRVAHRFVNADHGIRPVVPGARGPATHPKLGIYGGDRDELLDFLVDELLPRPRNLPRCAWVQSFR